MKLPNRRTFRLDKAAEILNCTIDDIVHWAAHGETRIGIPYSSDSFNPPYVYDGAELNKCLEDYSGFAFIDRGYLVGAEMQGNCSFTSLELDDGRTILFKPDESEGSEWHKYVQVGIKLDRLFIRAEELDELVKANQNIKAELHQSGQKQGLQWGIHETTLLQKLAAASERFWKLYDPADPTTAPTNQQVIDWLKGQGVSDRTAEVMATILRADGLPTGPRK